MASTAIARKPRLTQPNTANQAVQPPTGQSSVPPKQIGDLPLKTNIRSEYVAGGSFFYQPSQYLRSLPPTIDDLSQQFGADIYDRMTDDSKVASAVNWLKLSTLAQGVRVVPTVQDETEEGYNQSQDIADFCQENLERIDPPLKAVCWSMLDAVVSGYKVAEQTYEYVDEQGVKTWTYLKTIKVKPRHVTAFVVDAFQNLKAILGLVPGGGMGSVIPQGLMAFGPGTNSKFVPSNLIDRDKFLVFTHRPKDNDPRGTSSLRPAYSPWWLKQQAVFEYTKYLSRFASPSLFGTTPAGAQGQVYTDSLGTPILDANGNYIQLTPEQAMQEALVAFQNGSVVAFQNGADVKPIKAEGNGEAFMDALTYADKQIDMSVTSQTLASGEAGHQTGAATDAHQDVSDMVIAYTKEALATVIKNDCLRVLVALNYGEEAAKKYTPDISLSEMPQQDFSANANSLAVLWKSGYLDPSQQPKLDAQFNLPERSQASIEESGQEQGMGAGDGEGETTQVQGQQAQPQQPKTQPQPGQGDNQDKNPKQVQKLKPNQDKADMSVNFDHWVTIGEGDDANHVLIKGGGGDSLGSSKSKEPEKKTAQGQVSEIEKKIYNKPLEETHVYSPDGKEHSIFPGDETHCFIPGKDVERIRKTDSTLTHNHPGGEKYENGSSFSLVDVKLAYTLDLKEIHAVSANAQGGLTTFVMERPENGWLGPHHLNKVYKEVYKNLSIEYHAKHPNRDVSFLKFMDGGDRLWSDIQTRLPAHMKIKYSRTNSKG